MLPRAVEAIRRKQQYFPSSGKETESEDKPITERPGKVSSIAERYPGIQSIVGIPRLFIVDPHPSICLGFI